MIRAQASPGGRLGTGSDASIESRLPFVIGIIVASFLFSTAIAIIAVIAGVGGGVLFTPIMMGFTGIDTLISTTGLLEDAWAHRHNTSLGSAGTISYGSHSGGLRYGPANPFGKLIVFDEIAHTACRRCTRS